MKKTYIFYMTIFLLVGCGNPSGVSDEYYQKYKELGAPKILYSCTITPGMTLAEIQERGNCAKLGDDVEILKCLKKPLPKKAPITEVGYTAGVGIGSTYNKILMEAKNECSGEFKIIESKQ